MSTVICPRCGQENLPGDRFCGYCGRPLNAKTSSRRLRPSPSALVSIGLWISVVVVLLLGGVLWLSETSRFSRAAAQSPPTLLFKPPPNFGEIRIIPYNGFEYDTFPDFVGSTEVTNPGVQRWQVTLSPDQIVRIGSGWCAEASVYQENMENIVFSYTLDDREIPLDDLAPGWSTFTRKRWWGSEPWFCRTFKGLVISWPPGEHRYTETRRHLTDIFDGENDYPAGEYTNEFLITVQNPQD
ncbi:MAG TPA: zinc ribbon domain-containing protein [Anaerolineae bacterium]|nr:zinc ribbon domain-containing protein [Anaerolineae bacterium]